MEAELMVVFADKDFKVTWAKSWDANALKSKATMATKDRKRIWETDKLTGFTSIMKAFPKNWKSTAEFDKVHQKWWFARNAENVKRAEDGKSPLTQKEFFKGMPKFVSKIGLKDVRVVFAAKDCRVWLMKLEDDTFKKFNKIIRTYEDTVSGKL